MLLVYDGDCAFCSRCADVARRLVVDGRYELAPWQCLDLSALGLSEAQCEAAAWFVDDDGALHAGHRAVAAALRHGRPALRPLGRLLAAEALEAPAAAAYAWVARHRDALPGGAPTCAQHGA